MATEKVQHEYQEVFIIWYMRLLIMRLMRRWQDSVIPFT